MGIGGRRWVLAIVLTGLSTGCANTLMPTPNLYLAPGVHPFEAVRAEFQSNAVDVLYVTDREQTAPAGSQPVYTSGRSRSMAFGRASVSFGEDVSWKQLVRASCTRAREMNLPVRVGRVEELERFPPTPPQLNLREDGSLVEATASVIERQLVEGRFRSTLQQWLQRGSDQRDVFLYIHGFNNGFEASVQVIAQVWHFLGRRGVPLAYSWPAGRSGLRGYGYDRESGEFTIFHLKHLLRLLGECPSVGRVHIIAHSRGTDVAVSALRELHLAFDARGQSTRDMLKLGVLVLAAPDIDLDVSLQRLAAERLFQVPEATVIYSSREDWALWLANLLFLGIARIGELAPEDVPSQDLADLRRFPNVQLIDTTGATTGVIGHDYFRTSPAVSSDLILVLRDRRPAGAEHGRPMKLLKNGFWQIEADYPTCCTDPDPQPPCPCAAAPDPPAH